MCSTQHYSGGMLTPTTATHTVRIQCACRVCLINSRKVGAPFPLAALIVPAAAAKLGITDEASASHPAKTHGTVYMAHHPAIGKFQSMALAVTA